jgi:ABC-2 type transport system permease protein
MRNIWTISKREIEHYLASPVAYLAAFALMLIIGLIFFTNIQVAFLYTSAPSPEFIIAPIAFLLIFLVPAITMGSIADEYKTGTLETIMTAPIQDWELIIGKWLGGVFFFSALLLFTWVFPLILNQFIDPGIDQGILVSGYLGVFLLMAAFVSIGIFTSSLLNNSIASYFLTFAILLLLWMISAPSQAAMTAGNEILKYLDFSEHFYPTFLSGVIDLKDVVFYLSATGVMLFLGTASLEARRWK